jgi:hypothetical protein
MTSGNEACITVSHLSAISNVGHMKLEATTHQAILRMEFRELA